ncbi:exonuclease SbcD [Bacillus mesophilus]|uniref:Nuclease SbcCD subunit D n=1 Tax=Bacillus mesophilus TaxID=1808955 RepID=A0A6M0Q6E5_9BACI|nr:exonuclease SbcCD subunit D [Bacillus mesophilus]MBM7659819.1 exonuclease SbcD [Bacillus mesophilus]NEY70678.1 exonuclease SbcCD subunit D [Bacillus mesophilus]
MRILHTADWHLGKTLEGRSRLEEQAQFMDELVEIVEREQVDVVLMAGDVFDTVNPPALAEQLFYEGISRLSNNGKRSISIIAGNHDSPDRLLAAAPLAKKQGISIVGFPTVQVQSIYVPTTDETLKLAALPYPSESRLSEVLSEINDELALRNKYDERIQRMFQFMSEQFSPQTVNVAMSHLYVQGGSSSDSERPIEVGGAYTVAGTSLPKQAQYVALGHLHRPQMIKRAETIARYSGSPLAYSFSEAGYTKSVSIIDVVPGGEAQVTEIYLSSGKPLVRWKATEGVSQVHQWLDSKKDQQAWIDLEIHVTNTLSIEEIQRIRKSHAGIIHIRPVFEAEIEQQELAAASNLPVDELFKRFYERQTGGAKLEPELLNVFLELLNEEKSTVGEED